MTDPWAPPPPQQQQHHQPHASQPPAYQPPYGYPPPYAPTPRRRLDKQVVGLAVAIAVLLTAGFGTLLVSGVTGAVEQERAEQRQLHEADKAFDEALAGPADTATVSPAPDGSRVYRSPSVESNQHAFRLRLPRGWEGRHVGVREDATNFSDSILLLPDSGAGIVIYRVDFGARAGTEAFERALVASLRSERERVTLTSRLAATTVGDEEPAYAIRAEMTNDDGEEQRLRVVVFDHGGETFQVVQIAPAAEWTRLAPGMGRILDSWRWG